MKLCRFGALDGIQVQGILAYVLFVRPSHRSAFHMNLAEICFVSQFTEHAKVQQRPAIVNPNFAI